MSPSSDPAALGGYVDAAAPLLGLAIAPDWREGVIAHLSAILAAGARFDGFALPDETEAAPVFEAAP